MTPIAAEAPLAEKSSATIVRSRAITSIEEHAQFLLLPPIFRAGNAIDVAAYAHAIAFTTTKYLSLIHTKRLTSTH